MLRIEQATKTFGSVKALDQISLTVPRGSVYGLVGPNGAGKSTALRVLSGVYRPDQGRALLEGQPLYENPAAKQRFFFIPDDLSFYSSSTMKELASFYASFYPAFDWKLFDQLTALFNLPMKQPLRHFSKGMQKQGAFQLALAARTEVLMLDEPVDGLDPVMRRQIASLILADVAKKGTTVLISSHNLRELEDLCDHVGMMDKGKMLLEKSLADMQGSIFKVQLLGDVPEGLDILSENHSGRMKILTVRGTEAALRERLQGAGPAYFEIMPLTLEEIFISELGGVSDEIHKIIF